jgi:hypothetical protein
MFRISTLLDRRPSNYFKKWVEYHTQVFNKNQFIFINFSKDNEELKEYLTSQGFNNLFVLTVTKNKIVDTNKFDEEFNTLLEHMVDLNVPIIFHCPYECLIPSRENLNIYKLLISETPYIINRIKSQLVHKKYKFIFLDSDELLVGENIHQILETDFEYIIPEGYDIIQNIYEEKLGWNAPIYMQRSYWVRNSFFCDKPIIVQKNINWGPGRHLHLHKDNKIPVEPNIKLLHLRDVCFDSLYEENNYTKQLYPFSPEDHRKDWEDYDSFKGWILEKQKGLELIPNEIRILLEKFSI